MCKHLPGTENPFWVSQGPNLAVTHTQTHADSLAVMAGNNDLQSQAGQMGDVLYCDDTGLITVGELSHTF